MKWNKVSEVGFPTTSGNYAYYATIKCNRSYSYEIKDYGYFQHKVQQWRKLGNNTKSVTHWLDIGAPEEE